MKLKNVNSIAFAFVIVGIAAPFSRAEKIYWTDFSNHKIQRANLDGTEVEDLVISDIFKPYGIALDLTNAEPCTGQTRPLG